MKGIYRHYKQDQTLRLDEKELAASYGKGHFIFLGSSTDMFAHEVPTDWIVRVYDHCCEYPENRYLMQSKNPSRFLEAALIGHPLIQNRDGICFATTQETNRDTPVVSKAQSMQERALAMEELSSLGFHVMITMEPIMEFDLAEVLDMLQRIRPFQVNIGCNTARTVKLPEPSRDEIIDLVNALRNHTNVKLKSNSSRILGDLSII